jgi:hypothetical protein
VVLGRELLQRGLRRRWPLLLGRRPPPRDRRGYLDGPIVGDVGFTVELLHPQRLTFEGRTEELALAWCLLYPIDGRAG